MGKGAQYEGGRSQNQTAAMTTRAYEKSATTTRVDAVASTSRAMGDDAYDLTLVNGRTGGGLPEDGTDLDRARIAERRLLETQQVLVQERLAREVAEAILSETAKALSAVRKAAAAGGAAKTEGVPLRGGGEEAVALLEERLTILRADYETLRVEAASKDSELEKMRSEVSKLEEGYSLVEGGKPVTIEMNFREITRADQDELVVQSKALLNRAKRLEQSVAELREVDERRVRTIAELMSTMEQNREELKEKLRDAGLLDEDEYDDERVGELGTEGLRRMESAEGKAAMAHMHEVAVTYDGPATSPLGKNFYVTRTASFWDRWFGVHV